MLLIAWKSVVVLYKNKHTFGINKFIQIGRHPELLCLYEIHYGILKDLEVIY